MTITVGDRMPEGKLLRVGENGPEPVALPSLASGRVAIFGLPGAFTGTCNNAHMPSFIRTAAAFRDRGVSRIVCLTVNDPFVADAWTQSTGADRAGIEVLADADGSGTRALGLSFDFPAAGLHGRCKRFAALLRDGQFEVIHIEDSPGTCSTSAGEALLEKV